MQLIARPRRQLWQTGLLQAKAHDLARSGYFYGLPPLEFELSFDEGFDEAREWLDQPSTKEELERLCQTLERSTKLHNRAAVRCGAINCKVFSRFVSAPACNQLQNYAVSALCESWERSEHKQPEPTAAVGASSPSGIPRIGISDPNTVHPVSR